MNSLTPFVRHELEHRPGAAGKATAAGSLVSPPLGTPPQPGRTPHPQPSAAPQGRIPMTDGTPAACRQKNARSFLQGNTPGVMAQYAGGLFGHQQQTGCSQPAPPDDPEGVQALVDWREDAPYG